MDVGDRHKIPRLRSLQFNSQTTFRSLSNGPTAAPSGLKLFEIIAPDQFFGTASATRNKLEALQAKPLQPPWMQPPQKWRIIHRNRIMEFEYPSLLGYGLASGVQAKIRPQLGNVLKPVTFLCQPKVVLVVHGVVQADIKKIAFFKYPPSKETGSRRNVKDVKVGQKETAEFDLTADAEESASLIDHGVVAKYNVRPNVLFERIYDLFKTMGAVTVIRVKPANNITSYTLKSLIQRIALTPVWFGNPAQIFPPRLRTVSPKYVHRVVG
jgi:hypothetical protein